MNPQIFLAGSLTMVMVAGSPTRIRCAGSALDLGLVDLYNIFELDQLEDVSNIANVKLSAQSRLSKPWGDGTSQDFKFLDNLVHVVIVRVFSGIRIGVKI